MFLFFVLSFEFHVGVLRLYGFVYHQTKRSNERGNCDTFHIELLFDIAKNSSNCFFNLHVKHCETDGNYTASVVYFHGTVPDIHHICSSSPAPPRTHTCQERLATCLNVECERLKKERLGHDECYLTARRKNLSQSNELTFLPAFSFPRPALHTFKYHFELLPSYK